MCLNTCNRPCEDTHAYKRTQEFQGLADDTNIYKLVGPVLLKQDTSEAKSTVDGRLQYIEKEMSVLSCP